MTTSNIGSGGWPVNDINGLARRLPEMDPTTYYDGQANEAYEAALVKWPVLARLMGLASTSTPAPTPTPTPAPTQT